MASASAELEGSDTRLRWLRGGPAIVAILGASLWAQLFAAGIASELRLAQIDPWLVLAFMAPLAALGAGLLFRSAVGALLIFPVSLMPAIALLPEHDRLILYDGWSMARIGLTLAIYLAVTGAWSAGTRRMQLEVEPLEDAQLDGHQYRGYVYARLVPMILLFGAPAYGVFFDPAIVGTISQNYPGHEAVAQIFISIAMFFVWCVVAYTQFLVPALNVEYDRRTLSRRLGAYASIDRRKVWYRLAAWTSGVGVALILLFLLV